MDLKNFHYDLPKSAIAHTPHKPRDGCKLLIVDTTKQAVYIDSFLQISKYLPTHSTIVFNDTKVAQARLQVYIQQGKEVTILLFAEDIVLKKSTVRLLSDKRLAMGDNLISKDKEIGSIVSQENNIFYLRPISHQVLMKIIADNGHVPIPPYLKNTPLSQKELKTSYQSVFAKHLGSFAAPTASLHFTKRVLSKLTAIHIDQLYVTLHVGYGTFASIDQSIVAQKKLHEEYYSISAPVAQKLLHAKQSKQPIIAVGTTVIRTLESWYRSKKLSQETNIFIQPGDPFHLVDGLITNFHVPQSSLIMLIEAFLQHKGYKGTTVELYKYALKQNFKFLSFGDAMLIL